MALWGNKDLVYSDGTIAVNLGPSTEVTGSVGVTTFTTAGISTGNVITIGAGATYGYAVITGFTSTTISIASTAGIVTGITTVPSGTSYFISQEPIYTLFDSVYRAPESKTVGYSTSPVFTGVFGIDANEVGAAAVTTVGGKAAAYAVAHSGWVGIMTYIDTHGNLRVKSEVLVAGGINTVSTYDASDDTRFADRYINITSQPVALVGVATTAVQSFTVAAESVPSGATIAYEWQYSSDAGVAYTAISNPLNDIVYTGTTGATLGVGTTTIAANRPDGYYYRVRVYDGADVNVTSVFSNGVILDYA
jgi:hypothetical protein